MKRRVGAILVRNNRVVGTGYVTFQFTRIPNVITSLISSWCAWVGMLTGITALPKDYGIATRGAAPDATVAVHQETI